MMMRWSAASWAGSRTGGRVLVNGQAHTSRMAPRRDDARPRGSCPRPHHAEDTSAATWRRAARRAAAWRRARALDCRRGADAARSSADVVTRGRHDRRPGILGRRAQARVHRPRADSTPSALFCDEPFVGVRNFPAVRYLVTDPHGKSPAPAACSPAVLSGVGAGARAAAPACLLESITSWRRCGCGSRRATSSMPRIARPGLMAEVLF